jgi:hypothetical protein
MAEVADGQSIINVTVRIVVRNVGEPDQAMKYIIHNDICKYLLLQLEQVKKMQIRTRDNCFQTHHQK